MLTRVNSWLSKQYGHWPIARKVLALMGAGLVVLLGMMWVISDTVLMRQFDAIETNIAYKSVHRVEDAFAQSLKELEASFFDWSQWDDAYLFVQGKAPNFAASNFGNETLKNANVNFIAYYSGKGHLLLGQFRKANETAPQPLPESLQQFIQARWRVLLPSGKESHHTGFVNIGTSSAPIWVGLTVQQVLPTNTSMKASRVGYLLVGRVMGALEIERLRQLTAVTPNDLRLLPLQAYWHMQKGITVQPFRLEESAQEGYHDDYPLVYGFETRHTIPHILGTTVIEDYWGMPGFALQVAQERTVHLQAQHSMGVFMGFVALLALFTVSCTYFLLHQLVLRRLKILSQGVVLAAGNIRPEDVVLVSSEEKTDEIDGLTNFLRTTLTVLRTKENRLREESQRADAANHAKREFLANMSHELRTPLNGIIGMSTLMADTPLDDEQHEFLDTIHVASTTLLELVNDILDFSKIETGKLTLDPAPMDLKEWLDVVSKLSLPSAKNKSIGFAINIHAKLPRVIVADSVRLKQIVLNLISNAIKFTSQGGVTLHVDAITLENPALSLKGTHSALMLTVEDTGIGLAADNQERVFHQFEQADTSTTRNFGGTGLGLSIAKSLAELMGGTLGVSSELGKGSRFWIIIPLIPDTASPESFLLPTNQQSAVVDKTVETLAPEIMSVESAGKALERLPFALTPHILVVEDNLINQRVATGLLEKMGARVLVASGGAEALMMLEQEWVDLICMDCQMPDMDGFETTRRIRAMDGLVSTVPIIALTGNVAAGEDERCMQAGMNDYMSKPLHAQRLREKLLFWLPQSDRYLPPAESSSTSSSKRLGPRPTV